MTFDTGMTNLINTLFMHVTISLVHSESIGEVSQERAEKKLIFLETVRTVAIATLIVEVGLFVIQLMFLLYFIFFVAKVLSDSVA